MPHLHEYCHYNSVYRLSSLFLKLNMKLTCVLLIFALTAVLAYPQNTPQVLQDPKVFVQGGGSRKDGFDFSADVRKNVWESDNKRHAFDVTGGYSQHLGAPYGNSPADRRVGGVYTFRF